MRADLRRSADHHGRAGARPAALGVRVSAVVTAHNGAAYLAEAIASVLRQTRLPDEIVVIDDGSTDATPAVAERFAGRKVRYFRQDNRGPGAARNRGIVLTTGDFVAFLDCDDLWLPDKTERQLELFARKPALELVSGSCTVWDSERARCAAADRPHVPAHRLGHEILFWNCIGNPSMVLVRRATLERTGGFDETLRWGQDWELWMRILAEGQVGFVDEPVILYRRHALSHTRTAPRRERLECLSGISARRIRQTVSPWRRPSAIVRWFSLREIERARLAAAEARPWQSAAHASLALITSPHRRVGDKGKLLLQALRRGLAIKRPVPPPSSSSD